jgi:hypothetical protein
LLPVPVLPLLLVPVSLLVLVRPVCAGGELLIKVAVF